MKNLICNCRWRPGPGEERECFSGRGLTWDDFSLCGYRTCSLTQGPQGAGYDQYDPLLPVQGRCGLEWGYCLRAVAAEHLWLAVDFYDEGGAFLETARRDVASRAYYRFSRCAARFPIPAGGAHGRLRLEFEGRVTACTFCAPAAYYC